MQSIKILTGFFGLISAVLWVISSQVKVHERKSNNKSTDFDDAGIFMNDGIDFIATIQKQGKWNSFAALASAITTFLQFFLTFLVPS
jgi:hypothetical protein